MVWVAMLVGAGVLQSALISRMTLFGVHPDLVFVLTFGWTLWRGGREGVWAALVGGLVLDLFSVVPLGTFTTAMLITMFLMSLTERLPLRMTFPLAAFILLLASMGFNLVAMVMMQSLGWQVAWSHQWAMAPRIAVVNLLVFALLYRPLRWLAQREGAPAIEWRMMEGRL